MRRETIAGHSKPNIFMAGRAIPMIAFLWVQTIYNMYMYTIFLCPLVRVCVIYVVEEVGSFPGAWSINGCGA